MIDAKLILNFFDLMTTMHIVSIVNKMVILSFCIFPVDLRILGVQQIPIK